MLLYNEDWCLLQEIRVDCVRVYQPLRIRAGSVGVSGALGNPTLSQTLQNASNMTPKLVSS